MHFPYLVFLLQGVSLIIVYFDVKGLYFQQYLAFESSFFDPFFFQFWMTKSGKK